MSNLGRLVLTTLIITFGGLCAFSGIAYGQKTSEPTIKYVEVPKIVQVEVPVEVPKEVIKEVPVIRTIDNYITQEKIITVEKLVQLREFNSLEELKTWLAGDDTNVLHLVFGNEKGLSVSNKSRDCDDYAYDLQQAAEKDGYIMSIQVDTIKQHALNSVFIANDVYFIEPQTDEVWFECYRDPVAT
jgi:hypothetical protein